MKPSEDPPTVRAIIAIVRPDGRVHTLCVEQRRVHEWAAIGWHFVCTDPADAEALALWVEKTGQI